ncbi:MAG: bifunctional DNA-formamidopyrimidine glycosylase/DNA-(apurinic or apyrimidinic site) lyase [Patescibacteria group bacterium]
MPELPEVETIRRALQKTLSGQKIRSVNVRFIKLFHGNPDTLKNQTITEIFRRSKVLIIQLSKSVLLIHLKMTGQLIYVPEHGEAIVGGHPDKVYSLNLPHKHSHIIFELDKGTLYFNDLRKFGWVKVYDNLEQAAHEFAKLGPEYTWPEYTLEHIFGKLARRQNITIKQALLEQSLVAGVGNIYADETLFCAKIRPTRKAKDVKPAEIKKIFECIPHVFELSLKHGGTSSRDYLQPDGSLGTYLNFANVYKREGLPCKVCGNPIERIKISGRSSHFCPNCQK